MLPLAELIKLIITTFGLAFFGWIKYPIYRYYPVLLAVVLALVYRQFHRQAKLEAHLYGTPFSSPGRQLHISLGIGLAGGFLTSLLMVLLGLPLSEELGLIYVWPVVLVMLLIHPRFMCFAYGGGVVGAVSLLLRGLHLLFPGIANVGIIASLMAIDLPALMALVAVLHLTESFLIFISGHINASPVILRNPRGEVVAGFMLQRFWPLPITALLATLVSATEQFEGSIAMPDWWPLLQPVLKPEAGMVLSFFLLPIVATLGYSDIAVSTSPREKSKISARRLAVYSGALLLLSLAAGRLPLLQILPVLFAPLGHEYLIQAGNRREWSAPPLWTPPQRGVKLLATWPGLPAALAGLGTGWIIHSVNGIEVNSSRELGAALDTFPCAAVMDVESPAGEKKTVEIRTQGKLGIILIPHPDEGGPYLKMSGKGFLLRLWEKIKKKQSGA